MAAPVSQRLAVSLSKVCAASPPKRYPAAYIVNGVIASAEPHTTHLSCCRTIADSLFAKR